MNLLLQFFTKVFIKCLQRMGPRQSVVGDTDTQVRLPAGIKGSSYGGTSHPLPSMEGLEEMGSIGGH